MGDTDQDQEGHHFEGQSRLLRGTNLVGCCLPYPTSIAFNANQMPIKLPEPALQPL